MEEFLGTPKALFVVPVYQRNYAWQSEQCVRLFDDIVGVVESGVPHFLGTVCFKVEDDRKRFLVDGQQRLISMSLLLKAMHDLETDDAVKSEIMSTFLRNKGVSVDSDFASVKLHLNSHDDKVYSILLNSDMDAIEQKASAQDRLSGVYQNYKLFCDLIQKYMRGGGSIRDLMKALRQLTLVSLILGDENPQEIFESLNSTGVDLTNVDLFRNHFFMLFPYDFQVLLYDVYWRRMEETIGIENMAPFFLSYLIVRRRKFRVRIRNKECRVNERVLIDAFRTFYNESVPGDCDEDKTEWLFSDMLAMSKLYKNFVFPDDFSYEDASPLAQVLYAIIEINDSVKSRNILLCLLDLNSQGAISDDTLLEACRSVLSFVFRSRVCTGYAGATDYLSTNIMTRLDQIKDSPSFMQEFWKVLASGNGQSSFPSDAVFADALLKSDLYNSRLRQKGVRYFLYTLERNSPYPKGLPRMNDDFVSIEHIMPCTLSDDWTSKLSEQSLALYQAYLHTCGNLAITNYNSEMSNKSFQEKKVFYGQSSFYYTRQLSGYADWQVGDIEARSRELIRAALKIWNLPAEYQTNIVLSSSLHRLDEDGYQFIRMKPCMLMVGDAEYSVSNWNEMVTTVLKLLDTEDSQAFVKACEGGMPSFVRVPRVGQLPTNRSFAQLTDRVYVNNKLATPLRLTGLAAIVSSFDKLADTNYSDCIMFQLL